MKSTCTDGLLKRFHQTQDPIDWANTKELYNLVEKTLLEAERNHTFKEARLHRKNLRSQWKIINCPLLFKLHLQYICSTFAARWKEA